MKCPKCSNELYDLDVGIVYYCPDKCDNNTHYNQCSNCTYVYDRTSIPDEYNEVNKILSKYLGKSWNPELEIDLQKLFNKSDALMTFSEYQKKTKDTAVYPNVGNNLPYLALGICGESGEIAEHIKKMIRDSNGILEDSRKEKLVKEIGDVTWYAARLADEIGVDFGIVAEVNLKKLQKRKDEGKLHGSGSDR